jgi:transcriptional regulator GlxA family with amidase domain
VAILAVPGVKLLNVAGPLDVFAEANLQAGRMAYRLQVVAREPGEIRSSSGMRLVPDLVIGEIQDEVFDTLLVAGSPHADRDDCDHAVVSWLRRTAPKARRYGSIRSGALLLAAAGLLEGRRVTTHRAVAERLSCTYPGVEVDMDAIRVCDGRRRTAAGVTAGLDLALALVGEDLGRDLALRVATQLVMLFRRVGGQAQFSRRSEAAPLGRAVLQEVQRWAAANPAANLSVPALAARAGLRAYPTRHWVEGFPGPRS